MKHYKQPVSVLVVIYTAPSAGSGQAQDVKVLLLERADHPGYWQSVTGSREAGEMLTETAIREVREETGILVAIARQIDRAEIIARDGEGRVERHYVLIVFAGRPLSGDVRAGDDAAEARWVANSEFGRLNLTEDTRRILAGGSPL